MTSSLGLRPYEPGDEVAILRLFQQSYGKPMPPEFWRWRFQDNPAGGPLIELAWDGDTLAAHYAASPVVVSLVGKPVLTALSMTTMTHPDYRGRGLFTTLANRLYARMAQEGYLMVWGFPNDMSNRGFVRDLAWKDVYEIPMFRLNLSDMPSGPQISSDIVELRDFDKRFDVLWESVRSDHAILVQRDQKYLQWRFRMNPQNRYRAVAYLQSDRTFGYAVFKRFESDLDIVDVLAVRQGSIARDLVMAALDIGRQAGLKCANMWLPMGEALHLELEKLGFQNGVPVTYLGMRVLNSFPADLDGSDSRRWHYAMCDSDVF